MKPLHRHRGAAALEMGLLLPVLLAILFGIMDWSWYMVHRMTVVAAAEEGVRIGAGVAPDHNPTGRAAARSREALRLTGLDHSRAWVTTTLVNRPGGPHLRVCVTVPFDPLIGLVPTPRQMVGRAEGPWYGELLADLD